MAAGVAGRITLAQTLAIPDRLDHPRIGPPGLGSAGSHDCRVTGVAGIDLVVDDLEISERIYQQALRLRPEDTGATPAEPGTRSHYYRIGSFRLGLHQPI